MTSSTFTRLISLALVGTLALLGGCKNTAPALREAERTTLAFYEALRSGDRAAALDFYAPDFFERNGREQWSARLARAGEKLGAPGQPELIRHSTETQIGRAGGTFLLLVYRVRYAHGEAEETLRLKQLEAGGDFKIFAHQIRSPALREP